MGEERRAATEEKAADLPSRVAAVDRIGARANLCGELRETERIEVSISTFIQERSRYI